MDVFFVGTLAVLAIVAMNVISRKTGVAAPLPLIVIGVITSYLPFVPIIEVEPEWILAGILPPLLYSSAVNMPTMDFRRDFRTISALSVVLVVVSAVAIGFLIDWLLPDLGLAAGIALGAIISPTDAVATSVVRKAGVSPRIVTVLEGESMLNDASALVVLRSAVAAIAGTVSLWQVAGDFVFAVVVAVVIGWVVGWANLHVRGLLNDSTSTVAISFVAPFVAYLPTEHLGASGLVAAVTAGLVTGAGSAKYLTPADRIREQAVWRTIELLLEGSVFLIMGLELEGLIDDVREAHDSLAIAFELGVIAATAVLALRFIFVAVSVMLLARRAKRGPAVRERLEKIRTALEQGNIPHLESAPEEYRARYHRRIDRAKTRTVQRISDIDYMAAEAFGWREGTVLVWAGMRGAVTLAAAQSLPADAPHRSLLILIAFTVAAGTLLIQGGTLNRLVRVLGLSGRDTTFGKERNELREELSAAAGERLTDPELRRPNGQPYSEHAIGWAWSNFILPGEQNEDSVAGDPELWELRLDLLRTQRDELLEIRNLGAYSSGALGDALRRIDTRELGVEVASTHVLDE